MGKNSLPAPKGNIIVVDDNPDNLRVLSSLLTQHGYWVRKALNGHIALNACGTLLPDLILLDINMPDFNGYQVCTALKAAESTCEIPVIFISALDNTWDKVKAFEVGGADYITKPFQLEEAIVRVENQLNLKRLQNELQEKNRLLEAQNKRLRQEIKKRYKVEKALHQANQKLQFLASYDGLTGVYNRRNFDIYLKRQWQNLTIEKLPISLILCDIDRFKSYNDPYGYITGDECLKKIATTISNAVSNPASLVARYGGEEFATILPNTSLEEAVRVAQNIQEAVQQLHLLHPTSEIAETVTLSLGIASMIPSLDLSPDTPVSAADRALYRAKELGRNRYCLYEERSLLEPTPFYPHNSDIGQSEPNCSDRANLR